MELEDISTVELIKELERRKEVKSLSLEDEQIIILGVRELKIILSKLEDYQEKTKKIIVE
ncbi:MAG: hypothetical protein ACRDA0_06270 [Cetobacterium sp.]|uniref:hypothetical protein n=1 Tax=Cetobacterium sp. TaxID=2071632 RepID=UPI003F3FC567